MLKTLRNYFFKDIAIDLGTVNTCIYMRKKGLILNQPSIVSIRKEHGPYGKEIIQAVGNEAKKMIGRLPKNIKLIKPIRNGVISNFTVSEQMLKQFINIIKPRNFMYPNIRSIICVPCGSTQVDIRAIRESALGSGISNVYIMYEIMAAAIGAGLSIASAKGSMVVDIGGGKTDVAIISLGGIVCKHSISIGSEEFDKSIIEYIRRNYGILIGEPTAESIKMKINFEFQEHKNKKIKIKGLNISKGIPHSFFINSKEIFYSLKDPLKQIISIIKLSLEKIPPEVGKDISEKGIIITGGGSLLNNLNFLIQKETGLPVIVSKNPLNCVINGCGEALEYLEKLNAIFIK